MCKNKLEKDIDKIYHDHRKLGDPRVIIKLQEELRKYYYSDENGLSYDMLMTRYKKLLYGQNMEANIFISIVIGIFASIVANISNLSIEDDITRFICGIILSALITAIVGIIYFNLQYYIIKKYFSSKRILIYEEEIKLIRETIYRRFGVAIGLFHE